MSVPVAEEDVNDGGLTARSGEIGDAVAVEVCGNKFIRAGFHSLKVEEAMPAVDDNAGADNELRSVAIDGSKVDDTVAVEVGRNCGSRSLGVQAAGVRFNGERDWSRWCLGDCSGK